MNEKIEQLKQKAYVTKGGEFCFDGGDVEILDVNLLIELVAKECMALCLTSVGNGDYNRGRMDCHDNIKEVFGVKK